MSTLYLYLIIGAVILSIIGGLWVALKLKGAQADRSDAIAKAETQTAKSAQAAVESQNTTAATVEVVKESLATKQKTEQAAIDAGNRNDFSGDSF
jgi:uncharacterized membrane protein YcjF (UPF0283 family)